MTAVESKQWNACLYNDSTYGLSGEKLVDIKMCCMTIIVIHMVPFLIRFPILYMCNPVDAIFLETAPYICDLVLSPA